MNERIRRLYDLVSEDIALQAELNDVVSGVEFTRDEAVMRRKMAEALVTFAHAHGLELSVDDFLVPVATEGAIADRELAGVTGGSTITAIELFLSSLDMPIRTDGQAPTEFRR